MQRVLHRLIEIRSDRVDGVLWSAQWSVSQEPITIVVVGVIGVRNVNKVSVKNWLKSNGTNQRFTQSLTQNHNTHKHLNNLS